MRRYRENVSLNEIRTYIEMESHAENVAKMVRRNKENEVKELRKRKEKEITASQAPQTSSPIKSSTTDV